MTPILKPPQRTIESPVDPRLSAQGVAPDALSPFTLDTLIFHVTAECNLMCRHCWQRSHTENAPNAAAGAAQAAITPEVFLRVLKEAKTLGLAAIKFTGGEPFLHPEIMAFLEISNQEGLSIIIETNATLLDAQRIEQLAQIPSLFISVSLDDARSDLHDRFRGCRGAFNRTIQALRRLCRTAIHVQVIKCLHDDHVDALTDMIRLAADLGVDSIKINPIQPLGLGGDFSETNGAPSVSELLRLSHVCRNRLSREFSGDLIFSLPMAFRPFSEIRDHRFSVCKIFQILGLLPDGRLSFCGIGNLDAAAVIGNIHEHRLADIWHRAALLRQLRERLPRELKGVCSRCIFRAVCLGECRASAFYQTKDLMAPFWICQKAYEAGLFPASRLEPDPPR